MPNLCHRAIACLALSGLSALCSAATLNDVDPERLKAVVYFERNRFEFRPDEQADELLATAPGADLVIVRARTSTPKPSAKDELLVWRRALGARNHLIAIGVQPLKILINAVPAADFVADNLSRESQRLNQRVEIEMIHIPDRHPIRDEQGVQ